MNPAQEAVALLKIFATKFETAGFTRAASESLRVANELETLEWVRASLRPAGTCRRCGADLPPYAGRGARRKFCTTCSPQKKGGNIGGQEG